MKDKDVLSALKYLSRVKREFMLSEIIGRVKSEVSLNEVYDIVMPRSFDLNIKLAKSGNDYKATVIAPKKRLELKNEEIKKIEASLKSFKVPDDLERLIEGFISKKVNKKWDDPVILDRIRSAIKSQKADYWKEGAQKRISYEKGYDILGYLAYQFPVYFAQFQHIFYGMAIDGLLKTRMKILDVGSGPGVVPLSIVDIYKKLDGMDAKIFALELYDENIEAYMSLVPAYASAMQNIEAEKPFKADLTKIDIEKIPDNFDLIIFSNVLNELAGLDIGQRADIVISLSKKLSPDGNIMIIEPADKVNSIEFRKLSIELKNKGLGIYSPCAFIWCTGCNPENCWSFEQKDDIKPTVLMKKLADCEEPYRYMNTDIKYSYAILRKDDLTRVRYRVPPKARFARLSKLGDHVGKRINIVASLMSGDLGDKKYSLFKVCDGTSRKPVYVVLQKHNITPDNEHILKAKYGEVLEMSNVLVRYNKENDAYNVLISNSSVVSPLE
jgi:2-polyprenyl-3-methyl-5-hydroxy-6-metoxy-1,4-benzoquinol methylase